MTAVTGINNSYNNSKITGNLLINTTTFRWGILHFVISLLQVH